jgi:predicted deacylase
MAFELLGTTFEPGEVGVALIPVAQMATGYLLEVPVHVLVGETPGPTAAAVSTHHGEEVFTLEVLRLLHGKIDIKNLSGTLLILPVLSPTAYAMGTRNTWPDTHDLNRSFPGNPNGWFTDRLASKLWETIIPKIDALLDFHGGGTETAIQYTYTLDRLTDFGQKVHELALLCSAEILWEHNRPLGTLAGQAADKGIITITQEIGGGMVMMGPDSYLDSAVNSTLSVLQGLGMLPGTPRRGPARIVVRSGRGYKPGTGGLFIPEIGLESLGKTIPGGTVLGRVVSAMTFKELEVMTAPFPKSEIMMVRNRISKIEPGDQAYIIGDGDSGFELD